MTLELPRDLVKDGVTRTATSPTDYWSLVYQGFTVVDGPAVAEVSYEDLTPGQKAARTRAENKAREEAEKNASNQSGGSFPEDGDGESQNPDENPDAQAGDANETVES